MRLHFEIPGGWNPKWTLTYHLPRTTRKRPMSIMLPPCAPAPRLSIPVPMANLAESASTNAGFGECAESESY